MRVKTSPICGGDIITKIMGPPISCYNESYNVLYICGKHYNKDYRSYNESYSVTYMCGGTIKRIIGTPLSYYNKVYNVPDIEGWGDNITKIIGRPIVDYNEGYSVFYMREGH